MTRRSKSQLERDRADLLAVLEEEGPLETHRVVARALGYGTTEAMWEAYPWPAIQQALRDLNALRRAGSVVSRRDPARYQVEWRLSTAEDADVDDDARELERMQARWERVIDERVCPHEASEPVYVYLPQGPLLLGNDAKPVARICVACYEQLPVGWGCTSCEWVENRRLCDLVPTLVLARPCQEHV